MLRIHIIVLKGVQLKFFMGMAQAIFGLIWIGFIALFLIISIGIIVIKEALNRIEKIYKNLDRRK